MSVLFYVLGIIFFLIGGYVIAMLFTEEGYISGSLLFLCFGILGVFFIILGVNEDKIIKPTKQDVLDGKAIYEETIVIRNNDTIKTYEIVWKE